MLLTGTKESQRRTSKIESIRALTLLISHKEKEAAFAASLL